MRILTKLLFNPVILGVFMMGCGSDPEDPVVLLNYHSDIPTWEGLLILSDSRGKIIDSVDLLNTNTAVLSGDPKNERFSITWLWVNGDFMFIETYLDVKQSQMNNLFSSSSRGFPVGTISLNTDPGISNISASTSIESAYYPENIEGDKKITIGLDSLLYVFWNDDGTRKFAEYENFSSNSIMDVTPQDFVPMEVQKMSLEVDVQASVFVLGFPDEANSNRYFLLSNGDVLEGLNPINFYFPGNRFESFETIVTYLVDGHLLYRNEYFGDLPVRINQPDVSIIAINQDLNSFSTQAEGAAQSQSSFWTNSDSNKFVDWTIDGPINSNFDATQVTSLIESAYPEFDLGGLEYVRTNFRTYVGLDSYDHLVEILLEDDLDIESIVTEIRSISDSRF